MHNKSLLNNCVELEEEFRTFSYKKVKEIKRSSLLFNSGF